MISPSLQGFCRGSKTQLVSEISNMLSAPYQESAKSKAMLGK